MSDKVYTVQDYKSGQPRWCPGFCSATTIFLYLRNTSAVFFGSGLMYWKCANATFFPCSRMKSIADVLRKYKKIVVAEQNLGQFAGYLRMKVPGLNISQFNQVKGQPFVTRELIDAFTKLLEE